MIEHHIIRLVSLGIEHYQCISLGQVVWYGNLISWLGQRVDVANVGWFHHDRLVDSSSGTLANDKGVILVPIIDKICLPLPNDGSHV